MATTFENYLILAQKKGIVGQKSEDAIKWYRQNVRKSTRSINTSRIVREERDNLVNSWTNVGFGKLYLVYYDPKHKKTLPYYDSFPLIIPIEKYKDGILGLNLHYLPPILRAQLLGALYDTLNNEKFDQTTKMRVSYNILKSASKFEAFQPCIKRYLGRHFRSRFIRIPPVSWNTAVFLPVEDFQKKSRQQVWRESRRMIK